MSVEATFPTEELNTYFGSENFRDGESREFNEGKPQNIEAEGSDSLNEKNKPSPNENPGFISDEEMGTEAFQEKAAAFSAQQRGGVDGEVRVNTDHEIKPTGYFNEENIRINSETGNSAIEDLIEFYKNTKSEQELDQIREEFKRIDRLLLESPNTLIRINDYVQTVDGKQVLKVGYAIMDSERRVTYFDVDHFTAEELNSEEEPEDPTKTLNGESGDLNPDMEGGITAEIVPTSGIGTQTELRGEMVGASEAVGEEVDMEDEEGAVVEMGAETSVDAPIREALQRLFAEEDQILVLSESSPVADRMEGLVRGLFLDSEVGAISSEMQMQSVVQAPRSSFVETTPVAPAAVVAKVKDSVRPAPKSASFQEVSGVAEALPVPDKGPDIAPTNSPQKVEMIVQPQDEIVEDKGEVKDDAAPAVTPDQFFIPKKDTEGVEIKDTQSKDENVKPEPTEDRVDVVKAEAINLQDEIETVADTDSQKKETDAVEVVADVSTEASPLLSSEKDLPEKVDAVQVATRATVERAPAPESSVIAKTPDARKAAELPVASTGIRLVRIESNQAPGLTNFDARVMMGESRTESGKLEAEKIVAEKEIRIEAASSRIESGEVLRRIGMLSTTANLSDGIETANSEAANLKAANDNSAGVVIGTRHGITLRRSDTAMSIAA